MILFSSSASTESMLMGVQSRESPQYFLRIVYCIDLYAMTGSTALRDSVKIKIHCLFVLLFISRSIGIHGMLSRVYPLIGKPNYIFPRNTTDDICVHSFIRLIIWNVFMILLLVASKLYRMCQLLIKIPLLVIRSTL